jgi:thioredoxin reductase (NADPH)
MPEKKMEYDFIVIGSGGTGMAAGMYAARLGLKTLILGHSFGSEMPIGGVITTTNIVENYPGFIKLTGQELAKKIEDHARSYDLVTIKEEEVMKIDGKFGCFKVETNKKNYEGKTILFATGTKWKKLPESVKGGRKFENRGIAYCALCDGALFKNKIVCVVGGSDSAAKDALVLAEHAKKVYIIYRGEKIHPEPVNYGRVMNNKKIEIINNSNIIEIEGDQFVSGIILDKKFNESNRIKLEGIFVAIGHDVLSDLAIKLGTKVNKKNEIITDKMSNTNLAGVFAAGDVADTSFKQLITGVSEGCIAAYSAFEIITKNRIETC